MPKKIIISFIGLLIGDLLGSYLPVFQTIMPFHAKVVKHNQVIGFLPYWLLDNASNNYAKDITTLTYFGLNIDGNGHIVKLNNPQEENPAWYDLKSGKLDPFFKNAKINHTQLSLLISSGDTNAINQMLQNPAAHAKNLIHDVTPLMKKYQFQDLNLDIEYTATASATARTHFSQFVTAVKQQLVTNTLGTLTVEISPIDAVQNNLIDSAAIAPFADTIVMMAYDYHAPDSFVTGPVAPLNGAGVSSEYDVTTAVEKALLSIPSDKLILGMPLYGYEWETLTDSQRSAVIPGSGVLASDHRMESFLSSCSTCNVFFDPINQEKFVSYQDQQTGTYHEIALPDQQSVQAKITFANREQLGGVALWALGYEGKNTLTPLAKYKQ